MDDASKGSEKNWCFVLSVSRACSARLVVFKPSSLIHMVLRIEISLKLPGLYHSFGALYSSVMRFSVSS